MEEAKHEVTSKKTFALISDENRLDYFRTELNTLTIVLDLMEKEHFKECFILLRTVLEKFLYFWLMMDDRKYRFKTEYHESKLTGEMKESKLNEFHQSLLKAKAQGNPDFKDARIVREKGKDVITVYGHLEGLFRDTDLTRTGELIPQYLFSRNDYNPNVKHLSRLETIQEGRTWKIPENMKKTQDMIYHYFIRIDAMLDNLVLNRLVSKEQSDWIMVHYNFLSTFTHPSKNSIRLWQRTGRGSIGSYHFNGEILTRLTTLYVAKLMQLYIEKLFLRYRADHEAFTDQKFDQLISELRQISTELWFIDNEPLPYDIEWSEVRKNAAQYRGRTIKNNGVWYYDDPYERQKKLWQRANPDWYPNTY